MENTFFQIVEIIQNQLSILKEIVKWELNTTQKQEIFMHLSEICKMLPALVSGRASFKKEESNVYETKLSKSVSEEAPKKTKAEGAPKTATKKEVRLPGKWVEQKDGWYKQVLKKSWRNGVIKKKTGGVVENVPSTRDTVHRAIFGAVQNPASKD